MKPKNNNYLQPLHLFAVTTHNTIFNCIDRLALSAPSNIVLAFSSWPLLKIFSLNYPFENFLDDFDLISSFSINRLISLCI